MKVVIIGGVAGGASAAARLRRLDERAEIVVLERTGYMSYANCGLPYYIGGAIRDESELTLQTPESFYARFRVDVRLRQEATAINRAAKTVAVRPLDGGACYTERYDKLILAPGARPVMPRLPGVDSPRIYTLRTVEDTLRIRAQAVAAGSGSAVIVGGGFIGVELAENLRLLGLRVTIVEKQPQLLGQFDADMVSFLHAHLREKGVELLLGRAVARFAETDGGIVVHTDGGVLPPADMVVLAVGVAPESTLAAQAGLTLGARGAIVVDAHMQTSDPDIYAVGDAVEVTDRAAGQPAGTRRRRQHLRPAVGLPRRRVFVGAEGVRPDGRGHWRQRTRGARAGRRLRGGHPVPAVARVLLSGRAGDDAQAGV